MSTRELQRKIESDMLPRITQRLQEFQQLPIPSQEEQAPYMGYMYQLDELKQEVTELQQSLDLEQTQSQQDQH